MLYSELMIFIGYKDNSYWFMYHIQGNVIFYSTHAIFNKEFFPKYTDSCIKQCKLYNKLLDKVSSETELSVPEPSSKDGFALIPIHSTNTHSSCTK